MKPPLLRLLIVTLILGISATVITFLMNSGGSDPGPGAPAKNHLERSEAGGPSEAPGAGPEAVTRETAAAEPTREAQLDARAGLDVQGGTGFVSGRVVNTQAQAVADARIELFTGHPTGNVELDAALTLEPTHLNTTTGSDGTYQFESLPARTDYVVIATHPDYGAEQHGGITVREGDTSPVPDIEMRSGHLVQGTVLAARSGARARAAPRPPTARIRLGKGGSISRTLIDQGTNAGTQGTAIAGARVELWSLAFAAPSESQERIPWKVTETDAAGHYEFKNVSYNNFKVTVSAKGYGTASRLGMDIFGGAGDRELDFVLRPGSEITGVVVDASDRPVAGAAVYASEAGKQDIRDGRSEGSGLTDQTGAFAIRDLAAGTYSLRCAARGFTDQSLNGIESGPDAITIQMQRPGSVSGMVHAGRADRSGRAVDGVSLTLLSQSGAGPQYPAGKAQQSAGGGNFLFEQVDPGTYLIEARGPGFAATRSEPFEVQAEKETKGVEITMNTGGRIKGVVVTSSGAPVAGAQVRLNENGFVSNKLTSAFAALSSDAEPAVPSTRTNGKGEFDFDRIAPGAYQIAVEKRGFASRAVNDVNVTREQTTELEPIVLPAGGSISGLCKDALGRPFAAGSVQLINSDNFYGDEVRPDYDGRFSFEDLPPGEYALTLVPRSAERSLGSLLKNALASKETQKRVQVSEGSDVTVVLTLSEAQR